MMAEVPVHQTHLAIAPSESLEVEAGVPVTLQVDVSCTIGCDFQGVAVTLASSEGLVRTSDLIAGGDGGFTTAFALRAPEQVGEYSWTIRVPRIESANAVHEDSALTLVVRTIPHKTSLAVWDVTSPVSVMGTLKLKVGAKCSANCPLTGQRVDLFDEQGTLVREVKLGDAPLEGTIALHWADVELQAPATEGMRVWSVALKAEDLHTPHDGANATFSFRSDRPPQHRVIIELLGNGTQSPLEEAEVRMGLYARMSSARGLAVFELPEGSYDLSIRKDGYEVPPMTIAVGEEMTVRIEAMKTLTQAEREERLARFVDVEWG